MQELERISKLASPPVECPTEQDYFDLWMHHLAATQSPTVLAELGGRLADRAAWVFVAGYQGALRQCFPALGERPGWASYLVSEAREDKSLATCYLRTGSNGSPELNGTKNWAAASAHLQTLVVNASLEATGDGGTTNVLIDVGADGVALLEKPSGRFLPELVVGRAEFSRAALSEDAVLPSDKSHAPLFGLIEARCLLVALAGHFSQLAPNAPKPAQSLLLSGGLVTSELATQASLEILIESMDLLVEWFEHWLEREQPEESAEAAVIRLRWAEDQRLLQMHRPLLEKRLARDTNKD